MNRLRKIWNNLRNLGYEKQIGRLFVRISIKKPYAGLRLELDFSIKSSIEIDLYFGIYYYVVLYFHIDKRNLWKKPNEERQKKEMVFFDAKYYDFY